MAIWPDLVSDHGFPHGYQTVKRFVRKRGSESPQAVGIILAASSTTAMSSNAGPRSWRTKLPAEQQAPHRKPAGKPRRELWETSRRCSHRLANAIFFELRGGNGPPPRKSGQRPVASARTAVKDQSPLRGAPFVSRSGFVTDMTAIFRCPRRNHVPAYHGVTAAGRPSTPHPRRYRQPRRRCACRPATRRRAAR
jgi:hypothetical protein